jgi:TnpA family transposase
MRNKQIRILVLRTVAGIGINDQLCVWDVLSERVRINRTTRELNKGEAGNGLARAVFIHRLGEIRDRTYEN